MSTKTKTPKAAEPLFATAELAKLVGKRVRLGYQMAGESKEVRGIVRMIFADSPVPYIALVSSNGNKEITVGLARITGVETL